MQISLVHMQNHPRQCHVTASCKFVGQHDISIAFSSFFATYFVINEHEDECHVYLYEMLYKKLSYHERWYHNTDILQD